MELLNSMRCQVENDFTKLVIVVPYKRKYFAIFTFPLLWIIALVFTENLILSVAFGIPLIFSVLNNLLGKEQVKVEGGLLTYSVNFLFIRHSSHYNLEKIRNLRINQGRYIDEDYKFDVGLKLWGPLKGRISFDYGPKTIDMIAEIDEAEAEWLIQLLRTKISKKV